MSKISLEKDQPKIVDEKTTRKKFLNYARMNGYEQEMKILFDKYDRLLKNCKNDRERQDISKLGAIEVYKLMQGSGGTLSINFQTVIDDTNKE